MSVVLDERDGTVEDDCDMKMNSNADEPSNDECDQSMEQVLQIEDISAYAGTEEQSNSHLIENPSLMSQMALFAVTGDDNIDGNFTCQICGRFYNNLKKLKRHVFNSHRKEKKYVCNICGKRFGYKHILQEHQNLHYGLKPYVCSLCNKRFAAKSNLIQHRHRHVANQNSANSNVRPSFNCGQCQKKFYNEEALKHHENISHPAISLRCNICGVTCYSYVSYREHCITLHPDVPCDSSMTSINLKEEPTENTSQSPENFSERPSPRTAVSYSREVAESNSLFSPFNINQSTRNYCSPRTNAADESATMNYTPTNSYSSGNNIISTDETGVQVDCTTQEIGSISLEDVISRFVAQGRLFRCKFCDIIFTERGMYSLHIVLHGETPWECSICQKKMTDKNEFTLHFVNQQHSSLSSCF